MTESAEQVQGTDEIEEAIAEEIIDKEIELVVLEEALEAV